MSNYNIFADYYDLLTENAEYDKRSAYICEIFKKYLNDGKEILDLACGTGKISKILTEKGYNITGIDISEEMLTQAKINSPDSVFYCADMTEFDLYKKFDGCICSLDAINHLLDLNDVEKCFNCVCNSLKTKGIFIFDVNTIYKHVNIIGDKTFVFDEEDFFLSWDNILLDDNTVDIFLDFFVKKGDIYERFSENFKEKAYDSETLKSALKKAGFSILGIYDDLSLNNEKENSERLYFVCIKDY